MLTEKENEKLDYNFQIAVEQIGEKKQEILKTLQNLNIEEIICIKYLYAYMPISDIINYSSSLFLKFVKHSLMVKQCMPWGKKIETDLFLNYVLMYRINNEDIEFFSKQFFQELYERVKELSMYEAVIEVNYWCLEKATYQSTDSRTASPLTICKNTYGRCGEESTLAVAALRSIGIPARQCYTPRWAHCDDNHAWVEVWIDGTWHFFGACEPEIKLDRGWFCFSASKAMLVHNRVFSDFVENEIITKKTRKITEINLLSHYADTKEIKVKVINNKKQPVEGISVSFEIVNDSEFYPLTTLFTNKEGIVSFITGLGDLVVFAYNKKVYTYQKIDVRKTDFLILELPDNFYREIEDKTFNLVPPKGKIKQEDILTKQEEVLQEQKKQIAIKKRQDYEFAFFTKETAKSYINTFLSTQKIIIDKEEIITFLINARGNHKEIQYFLEEKETKELLLYKVLLLKSLLKKDLTDSTAEVLKEHLLYAIPFQNTYKQEIFINTLLCPRIWTEKIYCYRKEIIEYFTQEQKAEFLKEKKKLYQYILEKIQIEIEEEYPNQIISPSLVLKYQKADILSIKVLLVAILRTLGVPAKIQKLDRKVIYYEKEKWFYLEDNKVMDKKQMAVLILKKKEEDSFTYYKNYTIAFLKEGRYHTLNLENVLWEENKITYFLEEGEYRILTSNRQLDGTNLIKLQFVDCILGQKKEINLELLEMKQQVKKVTLLDKTFLSLDNKETTLLELLEKKNNILVWLQVETEPTEHLLNEFLDLKSQYQEKKFNLIFIIQQKQDLQNVALQKVLYTIPNIQVVIEIDIIKRNKIYEKFQILDRKLPLITIVNKDKEASYAWAGYNVGIGRLLLKF